MTRTHLPLNVLLLLSSMAAVTNLPAQVRITPVGSFHAAEDTDPFAGKGTLEVVSAPVALAGTSSARATITLGCYRDSYNGLETLFGVDVIPDIHVKIAVTGTLLDTTIADNGQRTVSMKARFDSNPAIPFDGLASDNHHVEFKKEPDEDFQSSSLLVGFPADGTEIAIRINLRDPKVADLIQQCDDIRSRILKERAADKAKRDLEDKQASEQLMEANRQRLEQEKEQQARFREQAEQKRALEALQKMPGAIQGGLSPSENHMIDDFMTCFSSANLGPPPIQSLYRQGYDDFMASPVFSARDKQMMAHPEGSSARQIVRLNLILRTTRQVREYYQLGTETRLDRVLPAGSLLTVWPDYQGCSRYNMRTGGPTVTVKAFLRTPGYGPEERFYVPLDALSYATDGQTWCRQNCPW